MKNQEVIQFLQSEIYRHLAKRGVPERTGRRFSVEIPDGSAFDMVKIFSRWLSGELGNNVSTSAQVSVKQKGGKFFCEVID